MDLSDKAEREKYTRRPAGVPARKDYAQSLAFGSVNHVMDRKSVR